MQRVSPKIGVPWGMCRGASRASFQPRAPECPKGVPRVTPKCQKVSGHFGDTLGTLWRHSWDTFWTFWGPGPKGPPETLPRTLSRTPRFPGTLSQTLPWTLRAHRARSLPFKVSLDLQAKTNLKARSLQCGFWPRNFQILICILLWIFRWEFINLFPPVFSKENGQKKKSTRKAPAKFTQEFVRQNSPRISAEAFS